MNIDTFENVVMLLAILIALLSSLFRYVEAPRRGYLCLCGFFLAHMLSDYYWTVYSLVMGENPDVSEFIAYVGWNICYVLLLIAALHFREEGSKKYFHPLMLLPIPLNIVQFFIYIQFGGIFNNLWQVSFVTVVAVINIQSLMYYVKRRKEKADFPYFQMFSLLYVVTELGMWTSSCYGWPEDYLNPYYYSAFSNYLIIVLIPWAVAREYMARGVEVPAKSADEIRFQVRIQVIVSLILVGGCSGGYYLANWMKNTLTLGAQGKGGLSVIAIILFMLSVFIDVLLIGIMYLISIRYKDTVKEKTTQITEKRNRLNLGLTIGVTLGLMVFAVTYTSRLFYKVSVTGLYESGEDRAESTAASFENYLSVARSTLKVTADTVEHMAANGSSQDEICRYIVQETSNQKSEFDDNFTGIYAYVNGEYMDGLEWVPPDDYDVKSRDWYNEAIEGDGRVIIVPPYVDAQTGSVVITICKALSGGPEDGRDVVALDVIVNYIQEITQKVDVGGKGYALLVNDDGMIIAHRDPTLNGTNLEDLWGTDTLYTIISSGEATLHTNVEGQECTLFVSPVMEQWHVVIVVSDTELLAEVNSQLMVNIIVSVLIFILITVFYYLGYKNEQAYNKKMEEMNAGRIQQEYEAEVLRLEKHAADEASKAKSSFLADMSHEIRTPINAILGMNEMILRESGDKNVIEYSRNIKNSGRNLLQLINSILDFSKIEDGKMEIVPVRYSLSTLITYLVNSVQERANAKGLNLVVNVDPTLPSELYGDDTRIDQIILNLLTNAVKYTPEGTVTLNVTDGGRTEGRVRLSVEVKDTGIGIKDDDMGKLFESFERLDMIRNKNIEGTGLGISITTNLLSLMGSELKVESTYGEGSSFSFDLWQKIVNEEPIGDYKVALPDKEMEIYRESFRAPDARILIVDDTKMNIIVAQNLLKMTGIGIDTALNGREAIKLCEDNRYDVILLDQRMPGMDGTETLKEIRALPGSLNADTPVVCLTADAIRGARERYMAEGFTDYLTKPVEGAALEKMLLRYLPADKVMNADVTDETPGPKDGEGDELTDMLAAAGFDIEAALKFCRGDVEIYRVIVEEFANEYLKKSVKLEEHFSNKEWNDYSILIHSVKSSSKTIGANALSEIAAKLEAASKNGDITTVLEEHSDAMNKYATASSAIREALGLSDEDIPESMDDGDILEFDPVGE